MRRRPRDEMFAGLSMPLAVPLAMPLAVPVRGRARGGAAPYAGPLDGLSTAPRAAYSTRKLLSAYAGSCLRLRRQSDDEEMDFGFVAATGLLDHAAATSWAGGAANIVTWYDQSGNGFNLPQTEPSYQPLFVASFDGLNDRPAVDFDGADDRLDLFTATKVLDGPAAFVVAAISRDVTTSYARIVSLAPNGAPDFTSNQALSNAFSAGGTWLPTRNTAFGNAGAMPTNGEAAVVRTRALSDGSLLASVNGVESTPGGTPDPGNFNVTRFTLGTRAGTGNEPFNGKMSEVVVFNGDPSETDRDAVEAAVMDFVGAS